MRTDDAIDAPAIQYRLNKLETENFHLQQLVAELLIKNQQLRDTSRRGAAISEEIPYAIGPDAGIEST